jgi:3-oxoacyl-[acyl-carrier protein] reductase
MTDYLLELSTRPRARRLIKQLGLPLPMPQPLRRARGPWEEQPLRDRPVAVGAAPGGALAEAMAYTLTRAGAAPYLVAPDPVVEGLAAAFAEPGEAYGRPAGKVDPGSVQEVREGPSPFGLVFDASGLDTVAELRALYDFFHSLARRLARSGRVVVLGRPPEDAEDAEQAATRQALDGFLRSVAKEIGRRGATANRVLVDEGAEDRLEPALRFLLSDRAAFVSAQTVHVSARAQVEEDREPVWVQPLEGQTALVTGAARGIGAAITARLAEEGAHVVCLDRPQDAQRLERMAEHLAGTALAVDVVDPQGPDRIAEALNELRGGVDVVVHNAGITRDRTLGRMRPSEWDNTLAVNLEAAVRITDRLLDDVLYDAGRVICLSSIAGIAGNTGQSNYAASKAGLIGWVRGLSADLESRGITVNAVAPGFIETRMTAAVPLVIREAGRRLSALGQGGQPRDVAEVIAWLASPGAAGITGQVLRICGGALLGA